MIVLHRSYGTSTQGAAWFLHTVRRLDVCRQRRSAVGGARSGRMSDSNPWPMTLGCSLLHYLLSCLASYITHYTVYSVICVINPPFSPRNVINVGDSYLKGANFKVRFFYGRRFVKVQCTKKNNLLISGGTQQSQSSWRCLSCRFYLDRGSFCCAFWWKKVEKCKKMYDTQRKNYKNVRHTLKNDRKSISWWAKGDLLVGNI